MQSKEILEMSQRFILTVFNHACVDLQIISNDISELQKNQATTVAKIAQYKRKLMDLSHRVLQVAVSLFFNKPFRHPYISVKLSNCRSSKFTVYINKNNVWELKSRTVLHEINCHI